MRCEYGICKIGTRCNIISGYAFRSSDWKREGLPVIKIGNISNGEDVIVDEQTQYVDESFYIAIDSKYQIKKGDILISLTGSHINQPNSMVGRCCRNYDGRVFLLNQRAGKIMPLELADGSYLYYLFATKAIKYDIANHAYGGANQVNVSPKDIMNIKWNFPNIDTQRKIANILSAYDDLIENNNRRIRILEQMAENLYKEWFSYDKSQKASSEVRLKEIIQIVRGLSYSTEEIDVDKGNNLVNLKNIQAFGGFRHEGTKLYAGKYKNEQIVYCGDLIMGVADMTQDRRTVGSVALVPKIDGISVISADLIKILSEIDNMFLFAMFKYGNVSKHISQFANGANVLHLRPQAMLNIKVMLPSHDMIDKYVRITKPMFYEIEFLYQSNRNLSKQRDMLLPRLISDCLEVKND